MSWLLKCLLLYNIFSFALALETCPVKCRCTKSTVMCLHQELTTIPKMPTEIHTLDLRFNKIYEIAPGVLSHLHQLRSALLNDNRLQALRSGAFHGLEHLRYLYLYRNRITHIDPDVFQGLQHLEQLYLQVNEIKQIDASTFSHMPRLDRLYLHNNLLTTIPSGSFHNMPRLRKLRLDSNALMCDCSLLWLVHMMAEHPVMKVIATCHGPPAVTGTQIGILNEGHLNCKQPQIAFNPQDVVISFGEDAMFTCNVTGHPEPEIFWLRDAVALPQDTDRYEVMDNGSLMIHNADESDVGVFECMAKNPAGEARSKPARMMIKRTAVINSRPLITYQPRKQIARIGQAFIKLDCAVEGYPKPHVSWLFNKEKILLDERISLRHNGSLFIDKVKKSDAGLYTCQAENVNGIVNASATLEVMIPPSFEIVPKDATVQEGDNATFTCSARGFPSPNITWYKDTMSLPDDEGIIMSENNKKITLHEVNEEDAGTYHCRAENSEGMVEISVDLTVKKFHGAAPKIESRQVDTDAFKGTSVQLLCEVGNDQDAEIEWRKDGSRIFENDRLSISAIGNLILNNLTITDSGRYECSAFNEYGRDTTSVFLTVKDHILPGDVYVNIALTEATRDVDQAIAMTINKLFTNKTANTDIHDFFKIARFPNANAREIARAAEIYELALDKIKTFIQSGKTVNTTEPFNYQNVLSPQLLDVLARLSGCVAHRVLKDCSDMCYHGKYRSIDGSCNNFANPMWGASLTGFRRILYPIYENGFSHPVGWNKDREYNGYALPSARLVSSMIIKTEDITEDQKLTHMTMQWGQWLDHDLDHALPPVSIQSWDGVDCKKTCDYAAPCFPIDVPQNDTRVTNRRCIDFLRTSSVCGSGATSALFGSLQPREQINQLTSFLDASQVYGFEEAVSQDLRDLTNENGTLRVGATFPGKKPLLPTVGLNGMDCRLNLEESTRNCFVAGDIRANEQVGLAAMHTIWMREHNRLANSLKLINPFWDGDRIYNEARKIVGAVMQIITYEHWLPVVLGPDVYQELGTYTGYNSKVNPAISNVFATAALRFGHTMINPVLHRYDENFDPIPQGHLNLRNAFFSPWRLVDEGGVDPLLRGMFVTPAKLKTPTQNLNSELTEQLFYSAHAVALDLAAINIQRGRDHAIPFYTKWRQVCNMSEVNSFDELVEEISDKSVRDKLEKLYGSVYNIDVWVGGVLEDQVAGGKVGPLFRCLLLEQFRRLRDGDRFWYENPTTFKPEQLNALRQTSLARVLCDNGDSIDTIGENVFLLPEIQDGLISCEDLPGIDLRYWADCQSCDEEDNNMRSRHRRSTDYEIQHLDDFRVDELEDQHNDLKKTVNILKERINYLENHCKLNE